MIVLYIALAYFLGASVGKYYPLIFIPISVVFFLIAFHKGGFKTLILSFLSFSLSFTISMVFNNLEPRKDEYVGMVIEAKENYYVFYSFPYRFYIYEKENDVEVGDIYKISSKPNEISFNTYESQFDFKNYLENKNIRFELNAYEKEVISKNFIALKAYKTNFLSNFDKDTKALISALLFGQRDYTNNLTSLFNKMNLAYLFSLSGVYISFLLNLLKKIFRKFFVERYADLFPLLLLFPYLLFAISKIGVLRACITYLFRYINNYRQKKKIKDIEVIAISGLLLMMFDYTLCYQMGFYIGFFLGIFNALTRAICKEFEGKWFGFFFKALLIFFFLLPVSSLSNSTFHFFQTFIQIFLYPVNEIYILFSLISLYSIPFTKFMSILSKGLIFIYGFFENIDISISLKEVTPYFIFFYYVIYFIVLIYYEKNLKKIYLSNMVILAMSIFFLVLPIKPYISDNIYFINVGQGDSILIANKGINVLIDTGGNTSFDIASETLIPFFKKKQIYKLDALITTHNDYDHAGGVNSLINNFNVKEYLHYKDDFPFKIGDLEFNNLNNMENPKDENDSSLVFNLKFKNKNFFLTGDMSKDVESYLIKTYPKDVLDCDILKVGHHGSNTSTSEEFIKYITPEEAVISCAKKNRYNHPNKEVIELLNKYNIKIHYTMNEGTIKY